MGCKFCRLNDDWHESLYLTIFRPGDLKMDEHRAAVAQLGLTEEPFGEVGRIQADALDGLAVLLLADRQFAAAVDQGGQIEVSVLHAPGHRAFRDGDGLPFRWGVVGEVAENGADGGEVAGGSEGKGQFPLRQAVAGWTAKRGRLIVFACPGS